MEIPQLVHEIINDYLYLVPWKARIKQLNEEYKEKFDDGFDDESRHQLLERKTNFAYNWRHLSYDEYEYIFNIRTFDSAETADIELLPRRYFYSNTKIQLRSLYF